MIGNLCATFVETETTYDTIATMNGIKIDKRFFKIYECLSVTPKYFFRGTESTIQLYKVTRENLENRTI